MNATYSQWALMSLLVLALAANGVAALVALAIFVRKVGRWVIGKRDRSAGILRCEATGQTNDCFASRKGAL